MLMGLQQEVHVECSWVYYFSDEMDWMNAGDSMMKVEKTQKSVMILTMVKKMMMKTMMQHMTKVATTQKGVKKMNASLPFSSHFDPFLNEWPI
jgi:hypothetical protein